MTKYKMTDPAFSISNDRQLNNLMVSNNLTVGDTLSTQNIISNTGITQNSITHGTIVGYAPTEFSTLSPPNSVILNNLPNLPNDTAATIALSRSTTLVLPGNTVILSMYMSNNNVAVLPTTARLALSMTDTVGGAVNLATNIGNSSNLATALLGGISLGTSGNLFGSTAGGSPLVPALPQISPTGTRLTLTVASAPISTGDFKVVINYITGFI